MQAPDDTRQPRAATGVGTDKCARGSRGYAAGGPDPRRAHRAGADDRDRATLDAAGDGAAFRGQAADELGGAASVHARRRHLDLLESPQGAVVKLAGIELINFSSNDYLGLANDPAVIDAASSAVHRFGVGSGASRLLVGSSIAHQRLEQRLAEFGRAEAAVLFNSGYAANVGILSALCGPADAIFSDERNHASLIDGCRLSRAKVAVYPH